MVVVTRWFLAFFLAISSQSALAKDYYLDKISENVWFLSLDVKTLVKKYKASSPRKYPIMGTPPIKELTPIFLKILKKGVQDIESTSNKTVASVSFSGVSGSYKYNHARLTPITGYFINMKDPQ